MDGQKFDTDSVYGDGRVDGVLQVDDGGVDRSVDKVVLVDFAPVESYTVGITFFFGGKEYMSVSTERKWWRNKIKMT